MPLPEAEQPLLADQPCDWELNREFIYGLTVAIFPTGATADGFTYLCVAGYVGDGTAPGQQSSAYCAGSCPVGIR